MARSRASVAPLLAALGLFTALIWINPPRSGAVAPTFLSQPTAVCSATDDRTTGGGWLLPGPRQKRTFGFQAGLGPNSPFPGHLLFVNHLTRERLEGRILTYLPVSPTTREMTGEGRLNGQTATFQLQATDATQNGSGDEFRLQIITPPRPPEFGILGGGNIVIHPMCAAVTAFGPANEPRWAAISDALPAVQRFG